MHDDDGGVAGRSPRRDGADYFAVKASERAQVIGEAAYMPLGLLGIAAALRQRADDLANDLMGCRGDLLQFALDLLERYAELLHDLPSLLARQRAPPTP